MTGLQQLRSGAWVTRERALIAAAAVLALTMLCTLWLVAGSHGSVDAWGRPVGTDFSNVWVAGLMANQGHAAAAWNWAAEYRMEQLVHRRADIPFYGWHYPPPFLLVASLLARMPYLLALAVWQAVTIGAALIVARRTISDGLWWLLALGFPAVFVCLGHGQNGFLTAALLGGGLLLLDRRPWTAGLLLGCLVYKPQFAPVLPVVLLAGGHWRALVGALASAAALVLLTTAIWGVAVWQAFAASLTLTKHIVIEGMNTGAWKIVSPFAAVRLNGGGIGMAYGVQGICTAAAIAGVFIASRGGPRLRNATAIAAALIATPYVFDYDMVALGIALAFLIAEARETGWRDWEKSLVALAYLAPFFGRQLAEMSGVPLNLVAIAGVWAIGVRRSFAAHSFTLPGRRLFAAREDAMLLRPASGTSTTPNANF